MLRQVVTAIAMAFEPHVWSGVVTQTSASAHRWEPQPKPRLPRLQLILNRVAQDAGTVAALARRNQLGAELHAQARAFAATEAGYMPDVVERLLYLPEFSTRLAEFLSLGFKTPPQTRGYRPARHTVRDVPDVVGAELATFDELAKQVFEATAVAAKVLTFTVDTPVHEQATNLFWFAYDAGLPSVVGDAMLGQLEGETALLILRGATHWSAGDMLNLCSHRRRSFVRFASLIAGVPGVDVPLVRAEERLNSELIQSRHRQIAERLTSMLPGIVAESAKLE